MKCKKCNVEIEKEIEVNTETTKNFYTARFCKSCWDKEKKTLENYSETLSKFFSNL